MLPKSDVNTNLKSVKSKHVGNTPATETFVVRESISTEAFLTKELELRDNVTVGWMCDDLMLVNFAVTSCDILFVVFDLRNERADAGDAAVYEPVIFFAVNLAPVPDKWVKLRDIFRIDF